MNLGLGRGVLRRGSIFRNNGDHNGGGFAFGIYAQRRNRYPYSPYELLYYNHPLSFYDPYQASAYYPNYTSLYDPGYGSSYPAYNDSFGSGYYDTPQVVTYYDDTPYDADFDSQGAIAIAPPVVEAANQVYGGTGVDVRSYGSIAGSPIAPAVVQDAIGETKGWGPILGEGNLAFSQGRYEEARQIYTRAMLIDERDGYAKMLFAWANFALGDYQLAAIAVRRALLTSPDLVQNPIDVRLHYGNPLTLERQINGLRTYVANNPDDREADLLLGYMFYSIGDLPRGLSVFNDLAFGDPTDETINALREGAAAVAENQLQGR